MDFGINYHDDHNCGLISTDIDIEMDHQESYLVK